MTEVLTLRRLRQENEGQQELHGRCLSQKSNPIKSKPQKTPSRPSPLQSPSTSIMLYTLNIYSFAMLFFPCQPRFPCGHITELHSYCCPWQEALLTVKSQETPLSVPSVAIPPLFHCPNAYAMPLLILPLARRKGFT